MLALKITQYHQDLLFSTLENAFDFTSALINKLLMKHVRVATLSQLLPLGRHKAIKILNTKIPANPYKMAIFPVEIPYSQQMPENPYRAYSRDFSLRVATLL